MIKLQATVSSKCTNKTSQFYDRWINFFNQPVKNNLRAYDNIQKISTGCIDDYATGCL